MNKRIEPIARTALGLLLLFYGFIFVLPEGSQAAAMFPKPRLGDEALVFVKAIMDTNSLLYLLVFAQLLLGLAMLTRRFATIALIVLFPFSFALVWFHVSMDPPTMLPALVLFVLNVYLIYVYKGNFKELLKKKPEEANEDAQLAP